MKCPYCKVGELNFFGDALATYSIPETEDSEGKLLVESPYLQTVYEEVRGIQCLECYREVTTEYNKEDPDGLLANILEKIEITQDCGFVVFKESTEGSC